MTGTTVTGHQGTCPQDVGGQTDFLSLSCPRPCPWKPRFEREGFKAHGHAVSQIKSPECLRGRVAEQTLAAWLQEPDTQPVVPGTRCAEK